MNMYTNNLEEQRILLKHEFNKGFEEGYNKALEDIRLKISELPEIETDSYPSLNYFLKRLALLIRELTNMRYTKR